MLSAASRAADTLSGDTLVEVPAVAGVVATTGDTGLVRIHPDRPRRGEVVFALAEGLSASSTRCTWRGVPLRCHDAPNGVLAIVPLPAGEPGGTHTLAFEYGTRRIARDIAVAEREFQRELVFLPDTLFRLVGEHQEIARDARALQRVIATENTPRQWSGRWREPISSTASEGYGVERFYYRASDSVRAITLGPDTRSTGPFGTDTTVIVRGGTPAWRHTGVDLPVARGTIVRAPAAGIVAGTGDYTLTGRTLVIDHGQAVHSVYFHLDTVLVREGTDVTAGAVIGRVGATGLATAPHLHYGIYVHGRDVEPAAWMQMPDFARDTSARITARR